MARITIDIRNDIHEDYALLLVSHVISQGRVSRGKSRDYYCWASVFPGPSDNVEYVVETNNYRKGDCFVVYEREKEKTLL